MKSISFILTPLLSVVLFASFPLQADELDARIEHALVTAGDNATEIERALAETPDTQKAGMRFLIAYMPDRDLRSLKADYLLENVKFGYQAWEQAAWRGAVPQDVFFNNVLPYASINEGREDWRKDFFEQFSPLVKDAKTPGEAAVILNQKVFPLLKVKYSTARNRADQAPSESIRTGKASCTGLSILLIDACRAVGVPARFAGTPLWTNRSGNHSWVEVYDSGWRFTGACEPAGDDLDKAWFKGRAADAIRDHRLHAIYAVSYKHTPQTFPLVWDPRIDYVFAVNVTDRYTRNAVKIPDGHVEVAFRCMNRDTNQRLAANITVTDASGEAVFEGETNDERFDANDHVIAILPVDQKYKLTVQHGDTIVSQELTVVKRDAPITIFLK